MIRSNSWTAEETRLLQELYPVKSRRECAALLERSPKAITSRAKVLKIRRNRGYHVWTVVEDDRLRTEYPSTSNKTLAESFGRSALSVCARAEKLGVKKTAEYTRQYLRECGLQLSSNPRSIATRIPKGNVPLNKGLRRPGWFRGRMRQTQFRKWQRPANVLPAGTIRANSDGYLRIKVRETSDGRGAADKAWEFVHRRIWEAAHGPIPKGHRIWWKDGNHLNCALENLDLLSGAEHMARTTIQRLPEELKEVIMIKGRLTRRIGKTNGKKQTQQFAGSPVRDAGNVEG